MNRLRRTVVDLLWGAGVLLSCAALILGPLWVFLAWLFRDFFRAETYGWEAWSAFSRALLQGWPLLGMGLLGILFHWLSRWWEPETQPPARALGWFSPPAPAQQIPPAADPPAPTSSGPAC